jgi:hypothetical protein
VSKRVNCIILQNNKKTKPISHTGSVLKSCKHAKSQNLHNIESALPLCIEFAYIVTSFPLIHKTPRHFPLGGRERSVVT